MISTARIIAEVARSYGVTVAAIKSEARTEPLTWSRHVGMWLARELTALSLQQIAFAFRREDHTTVMSAIRRVRTGRAVDAGIRQETDELSHRLETALFALTPDEMVGELLAKRPEDRVLSGHQVGTLCREIQRLETELALARVQITTPKMETAHD